MSLPEPDPFDYEAHLLACARGERQALQRLYQHEGARLLGVARRLVRDSALAEDIVHDAFIRIWTGAGGFDPVRGSARGWIFSVTRHLALNVLRSQGREVLVGGAGEAGFDAWFDTGEAGEPAAGLDGLLQAGRLQGCLEGLEPQRRACIVLAYVDGCSHADIARRQGTPLGTVKAWIKRSLTALRECMG